MKHHSIGILGIGNLLLRDEGFGVHFIKYLEDNFSFPESVHLLDGGTGAIMLTPFLEEHHHVLVIDTTAVVGKAGTIHQFTAQQVRGADCGSRLSPHQVGLLETMDLCRLRGTSPDQVDYFTIIPLEISSGVELSSLLLSKLPLMSAMVLDKLSQLGYLAQPKAHNTNHA
ncbi:MAG: HyaD/HybD family hydrogenase maturation endopeptidase [Desulfobulbaceae bacterium]|nr:HyaD/HybD family hydrogenase maturation endopeptidase [Desulfobulbaceae bacterium]